MADIVNGFVSPGYAVSETLQDILARKAKARHDAILEQISKQNADTSRMQAESYEKQREAEARWRDAQANKERLNDFYAGMPVGSDTKKWMQSAGYGDLIDSKPTGEFTAGAQNDDGSVDEGPFQAMQDTYKGSPQEQKELHQTEVLKSLIKNPEFVNADPLTQTLMAREAGITNWDPSKIQKASAKGHLWIIGPTGKVELAKDPRTGEPIETDKDEFTHLGFAPRAGSAGRGSETFFSTPEIDPASGKPTGKYLQFGNRGSVQYANMPQNAGAPGPRVGNNPPVPRPPLPTIDETLGSKYTTRRPNATREDEQQRIGLKPMIIQASPASQLVKDLAMDIVVNNPKNYAKYPTPVIVENTKGDNGEPLSADDKQRLAELLAFLRDAN